MTAQLKQVALTYVTRRSLWLVALGGLLTLTPIAILALMHGSAPQFPVQLAATAIAFPTAILSFVLVTQAKWQFCNPRARVVPGFAGPHVAVILALGALAFGVYPVLLAAAGRWNVLGISACAAIIAAGSIRSMHGGRFSDGIVAILAFLSLMTEQGRGFWVVQNQSSAVAAAHAAILVGAWLALAAWVRRLTTMREEDDDFVIPVQAYQGSASRMERTHSARAVARAIDRNRWSRFVSDAWHDRLARVRRAASTSERQRLLRYGFSPSPEWIPSAFAALSFLVVYLLMARTTLIPRNRGADGIMPMLPTMVLMPSLMAAGLLALRRGKMAQELLLPLDRGAYVDGLLWAVARFTLIIWLPTHGAVLALIRLQSPEMLTPGFVIGLTALSLAIQAFMLGVTLNISPNLSGGKRVVLGIVVMFVAIIPLIVGVKALGNPGVTRQDVLAEWEARDAADLSKLPEEVRNQLEDDPRRLAQTRRNAAMAWERTRPWPSAWIWTTVGLTAAIGAIATQASRRRWRHFELA